MSLLELWNDSPDQVREKQLQQLIVFSGEGRLRDGSRASAELREFLSRVPSAFLRRYAEECLSTGFSDGGLALQDIANEVGKRLGFSVSPGRYRGAQGQIGFDGVWKTPEGHHLVVEVKTTDTYRIDLNTVAKYRKELIRQGVMEEERSSILFLVGRQDTGDLEAQIRGSRYAWEIRVISVGALLRLLDIREELEDPSSESKVRAILIPHEYTRVDGIIDLVFSTTEDVRQDVLVADDDQPTDKEVGEPRQPKFRPVRFHDACAVRVGKALNADLVKRSRGTFSTPNGEIAVFCAVSKEHGGDGKGSYWFAFHPHQRERLEKADRAYVAFGCGSEEKILLFPLPELLPLLEGMHQTHLEDRSYWHVQIEDQRGRFRLLLRKDHKNPDVTRRVLPV
jgi:hypothetical protein